jgi:broad-specificity NMP kinase
MKLFIITGTCGAGKSTMKDKLAARLDPDRYSCVDSDETGLNWWDYAGTEREGQYGADTLRQAFRSADGRNLIFVTCMAPHDYITKAAVPDELTATFCIALWANDQIIDQRLRERPKERGFTTDEAIRPHIEYNQWISRNRGKYQLFIDTESQTPDETADTIATFITGMVDRKLNEKG